MERILYYEMQGMIDECQNTAKKALSLLEESLQINRILIFVIEQIALDGEEHLLNFIKKVKKERQKNL